MRHCIWCNKTEESVPFKRKAHVLPQTLGATAICDNVCDICNLYFGSAEQGRPSVETVLKETFNISRGVFLRTSNDIGKNKPMAKFSSIYFDVDFKKNTFNLKPTYKRHKYFQEKICRQLKRGLYKVFLEETERVNGDGHDDKYNFIREFARYDLGDFPLFYFERSNGIFALSTNFIKTPDHFLRKEFRYKYLVDEPSFYEFDLLGHTFGIATSRTWEIMVDNYIKKSLEAKKELFKTCKVVTNFHDIDLALSILSK